MLVLIVSGGAAVLPDFEVGRFEEWFLPWIFHVLGLLWSYLLLVFNMTVRVGGLVFRWNTYFTQYVLYSVERCFNWLRRRMEWPALVRLDSVGGHQEPSLCRRCLSRFRRLASVTQFLTVLYPFFQKELTRMRQYVEFVSFLYLEKFDPDGFRSQKELVYAFCSQKELLSWRLTKRHSSDGTFHRFKGRLTVQDGLQFQDTALSGPFGRLGRLCMSIFARPYAFRSL